MFVSYYPPPKLTYPPFKVNFESMIFRTSSLVGFVIGSPEGRFTTMISLRMDWCRVEISKCQNAKMGGFSMSVYASAENFQGYSLYDKRLA